MKNRTYLWIVLCCFLLAGGIASAQQADPVAYYYQFQQKMQELREKYPLSDEKARARFAEEMEPIRAGANEYLKDIDYTALREDQLYYFAQLAFRASNTDLQVKALEHYLEKYPRGGMFTLLVRQELFERYTLMEGKLEEAKALLPRIETSYTNELFKSWSHMTWAYNRTEDKDGTLGAYKRILDETIRRAGHEQLPMFYIGHSLPSMFSLMQEMGKTDEAVALIDESVPKLAEAPDVQNQLKTIRNSLDVLSQPAPKLAVDAWANGNPVSIEGEKGKVVVLDFWATWCGPCKRVYPELNELMAEFGDDVTVVGLTKYYGRVGTARDLTPEQEVQKVMNEFVPEYKLNWPLGFAADAELFSSYGVTGLPTVFIIDKQGTIRERLVGHKPEHKDMMFETVRKLLAE